MSDQQKEAYLGDGLYASFDGFMMTLRAPREHGDHWVGIEPLIFRELLRYAKTIGWAELIEKERKR